MSFGAFGVVEVIGAANGVIVLDQMCKASEVYFEASYTRNGGHDTIIVSGEISAVTAAVDSVKYNPPCDIVAAAVISGPAEETCRVMDEWKAGRM